MCGNSVRQLAAAGAGMIQRAGGLRGVSLRATGVWGLARLFELREQARHADGHDAALGCVGMLADLLGGENAALLRFDPKAFRRAALTAPQG